MPVHVEYLGSGEEILLIHGGASPETTWGALRPLAERWRLAIVHRRGYPPSPPPEGRMDWEVDAEDALELLDAPAHVVGHSYGGVAAAIVAIRRPELVRSLTLIEPALYRGADEDPEIAWFRQLGDDFLAQGLDLDRARLRQFMRFAGGAEVGEGELSPDVVRAVKRAHGNRPPSEADPPLEAIEEAGIPALVASGGHAAVGERMCDVVAAAIGAERLVAPGAGHFVQNAPGFAEPFEAFLRGITSR